MTAALLAVYLLARIISGEAGGCDVRSMIATAHVAANREAAGISGGWFGDAAPNEIHWRIAREWAAFADPTHGATMLVNDDDLPHVARYTATMTETFVSAVCSNGQRLHAFAKRGTP
jgi:hypothetical protein